MKTKTNEIITEIKRHSVQFTGTGEEQELYVGRPNEDFTVLINGIATEDYIFGNRKLIITVGLGDDIRVEFDVEEHTSTWQIEMDEYIKSIGGLKNGYYTNRPPIMRVRGVADGWLPMVMDLIKELIEDGWDKQLCDVKEKFGGLRFYTNGGGDNHYDIIEKYEKLSYTICEECGEPGEPGNTGWIKTLCDKHHKERQDGK